MKKFFLMTTLLFGVFLLSGCSTDVANNSVENPDIEVENTTEEEFTSTMEDVFKNGGEMTCEMSSTQEGTTMKGTLYIDGKKMRTDAEVEMGGQTIKMNTIVKDDYSYVWNNNEKQGFKLPYSEGDDEESMEYADEGEYEDDSDSKVSFKCIKKVKDKSVFDLPSNIKFSEMPQIDMPF